METQIAQAVLNRIREAHGSGHRIQFNGTSFQLTADFRDIEQTLEQRRRAQVAALHLLDEQLERAKDFQRELDHTRVMNTALEAQGQQKRDLPRVPDDLKTYADNPLNVALFEKHIADQKANFYRLSYVHENERARNNREEDLLPLVRDLFDSWYANTKRAQEKEALEWAEAQKKKREEDTKSHAADVAELLAEVAMMGPQSTPEVSL